MWKRYPPDDSKGPMQLIRTHLTPEERLRRIKTKVQVLLQECWTFKGILQRDGQSLSVPGSYWLSGLTPCGHPDRDCQGSTRLTLQANALSGCLLARVTHHTQPVHLLVSGNHAEQIQFHLISSSNSPFVPGQTWFNPLIGQQAKWWVGVHIPICHSTGFCSAPTPCKLL